MRKKLRKVCAAILTLGLVMAMGLTTAQAQKLTKFRVGYLASTGHILYFIAQEEGYFKAEGLDTELFLFTNSGEGINAVAAGKLDAGSFGTAPPFTFIERGLDIVIFGGQMTEGHALVAIPAKAQEFETLEDLRGKTIATVRLATGDVVLRSALANAGIDWRKDVTINELDSPASVLETVKKGAADAGIVWTPFRSMAKAQGLEIIMYSGEAENMADHPCCRQIATSKALSEHPERYVSFLKALIKAYDFYQNQPEAALDILAKYVQIDRDILQEETYGEHIASHPDPNEKGVVEFWNAMIAAGYIESEADVKKHINTALYNQALTELIEAEPHNQIYQKLAGEFTQNRH